MSRFLSALSRLLDKDMAQDLCAAAAMAAFIAFAIYGSAGLSAALLAWRIGQ